MSMVSYLSALGSAAFYVGFEDKDECTETQISMGSGLSSISGI